MLTKTFGIILPLMISSHIYNLKTKPLKHYKNQSLTKHYQFEDFLKKYEPSYIWEKLDKRTRRGAKISLHEETNMLMDMLDPTDELLNLKVENGNPDVIAMKTRRGWKPPKGVYNQPDPFSVRRRLLELMKQAIYTARNRLVLMQIYRRKYRTSPLYKMGFLMSRTDTNCKLFTQFSFRAYRVCMIKRQYMIYKYTMYSGLQSNERQLQHWFNIELLVELIMKNDHNCKAMLRRNMTDRKKAWTFID